MSHLGMGVMLNILGGNAKTVAAVKRALGQKITSAAVTDDVLVLTLAGGVLRIRDDGQSCCESRYMTCDDDLATFAGATLVGIELREAPNAGGGECHEVQFLVVETSLGAITVATHNEHNGYYGGFALEARWIDV